MNEDANHEVPFEKNYMVGHYNQLLIIVLTLRGEWDQQLPHSFKLQFVS